MHSRADGLAFSFRSVYTAIRFLFEGEELNFGVRRVER